MTAPAYQVPDGPAGNPIISVEYEVYGQVQGEFDFQKFFKQNLGLVNIRERLENHWLKS